MGSRRKEPSGMLTSGKSLSCHLEATKDDGTETSNSTVTFPDLSATLRNLATTFDAPITSVATISPVPRSFTAFMMRGPPSFSGVSSSFRISGTSSSSTNGGMETSTSVSVRLILASCLDEVHETVKIRTDTAHHLIISEHI